MYLGCLGFLTLACAALGLIGILASADCDPTALTPLGGSGHNCSLYRDAGWFFSIATLVLVGITVVAYVRTRR